MLNPLHLTNNFLNLEEMPPAKDIDQRTMRGSCWNPTEPLTLSSAQQQPQQHEEQHHAVKEDHQRPLLAATTPAWGPMDNSLNSSIENTGSTGPNSPTENSTLSQTNFGSFDFSTQALLQSTSPNYSLESVIKSEPVEHPEYDSGRETLHDPEEDDMIELSPEVLVQAEIASEPKEISNNVKQTPKRQITRKMLKCPMCNFEAENNNRDYFMDHLITHCAMVQRGPLANPGLSRNEEEQVADEDAENETVIDDDSNLRMPQITAQGNVKFYRCKKCKAPSLTKYDSWIHQREHMAPEKILYCKVCPFATEYKHHLEYHMRNHYGSKPFKCSKCNYTCVNKSMLNSHLKSHSSIYQYRCASCNYVTKYCHSLKVHLKRNMHQPAIVLNPDGTPNPNPIIDVNSSKRGPRTKPICTGVNSNHGSTVSGNSSPAGSPVYEGQVPPTSLYPEVTYHQYPEDGSAVLPSMYLQNINNQYSENQNQSQVSNSMRSPYLRRQLQEKQTVYTGKLQQEYLDQICATQNQPVLVPSPKPPSLSSEELTIIKNNLTVFGYLKMLQQSIKKPPSVENIADDALVEINNLDSPLSIEPAPLDLSNKSDTNSEDGANSPARKRRRVTEIRLREQGQDSDNESRDCTIEIESLNENSGTEMGGRIIVFKNGIKQNMYFCRICDIIFRNEVMYTIHMGYHGRSHPLSCNICGERCPDHVSFFVHVTRNEH